MLDVRCLEVEEVEVIIPGRSGYPNFLGRVVRVIRNSGNGKRYPNSAPKKHYPQFWVPDNSGLGSGIPDIPEFTENSKLHKISVASYI